MKIFFLGDSDHPNTQNWVKGLTTYGGCKVKIWSLPWPKGRFGSLNRFINFIWALIILRHKIKQFNPDLLIGYRLTSYGFIAAFTGIHPLVIAQQGETDVWPRHHWTTLIKSLLARFAIKRADLIHVWGKSMAQSVFELGGEMGKVLILPRGIDLSNFSINEEKSFEKIRIFASRSLHPDYGYDVIIQAIHSLKAAGIPVEFRIAGSGIEEYSLKKMVLNLNLDSEVVFLGRICNEALRNELNKSNVYISMPITEGVSASLLEAMACCCIPIVSDLPSNREWIDNGVNGFLVPVGDVRELTQILSFLWQHFEEFKPVLQKNKTLVEEYGSQKKNIEIFIEKYKQIIIS
jgi:glycosyltransferase involved in cell wall biosynthesis